MDRLFKPDKFTVFNIAPFSPGSEERLAVEMAEYRKRTGNDIVLYCLSLHPEGFPASAKAEYLVGSYRKLRRALEGSGIRLGVLMQSTLGHWPSAGGEEEPWMRSVTLEGKTKRFCPADPGCRKYLHDVARMVALEKPCFIMLDDDVHANGFFGVECFCERHVALFNAENGTSHTAETLRAAVKGCQPGDAVCVAFQKLQREFVNGIVDVVRAAVDEVDPAIPAGVCAVGLEHRFAGDTARRVAAKGQEPVLRVDNAIYNQRSLVKFAGCLAHTMAMCDCHGGSIPYLLDESDTFPHNRWSVSASLLAMKLKAAAFCGLRGSKLWYCNAHKGTFPVSRAYTDALAALRGHFSAIVSAVRGSELAGIVVPVVGGRVPWHPLHDSLVGEGNWGVGMAGGFGVPFRCQSDFTADAIYTLGGADTVARLSDEDLAEIFRHRVLVDGAAALALTGRGLQQLASVKATTASLKYNFERDAEGPATYAFAQSDETPLLEPVASDAEVVTNLCHSPFHGSSKADVVAPGMIAATNALGGRVVTTAFFAAGHGMFQPPLTDMRKAWFLMTLEKLGWDGPAVLNDQDATALERQCPDGSTLLAVFNTGFDELGPIRLRAPYAPGDVELLGPHGGWSRIEVTSPAPGELELPVRLPCANGCVLAFHKSQP